LAGVGVWLNGVMSMSFLDLSFPALLEKLSGIFKPVGDLP
jgi:hypothetical protein